MRFAATMFGMLLALGIGAPAAAATLKATRAPLAAGFGENPRNANSAPPGTTSHTSDDLDSSPASNTARR